jgi:hypothetical protein
MLNIHLSPNKKLYLDGEELGGFKDLTRAFQNGAGHGLLYLDVATNEFSEEYAFAYWKDFARLYLSQFSVIPDLDHRDLKQNPVRLDPPEEDFNRFLLTVPPMKGAEYADRDCLCFLWQEIEEALQKEIIEFGKDISEYFAARHSNWGLLGRVCFHLAENKSAPETPFAFMATYAH